MSDSNKKCSYNGIINIYKEKGYTSFDVVAKLRGILRQKKIGHTGTLDPMAEGVLIVCLGQGTKLCDVITSKNKEYEALMKFGELTDTEDAEGTVVKTGTVPSDEDKVREVIMSFVGKYNQIPPMYSAIKKDGKKLYEYAREGQVIEREPREVEIYSIDIKEINLPYVRFDVKCSKGTYIRSLCRDIGEKMGTCATLHGLLRSEVNGYYLRDSVKLSEVEEFVKAGTIENYILPLDTLLKGYDGYSVNNEYEKGLINGNKLPLQAFSNVNSSEMSFNDGDIIRVYLNSDLKGLYTFVEEEKIFKPYKMFL